MLRVSTVNEQFKVSDDVTLASRPHMGRGEIPNWEREHKYSYSVNSCIILYLGIGVVNTPSLLC